MALETSKTTIDSRELLERTASNLIEREKAQAGMPLPLDTTKIPTKEVIRPSSLEPDPLRIRNLFPKSLASFRVPETSARIFDINLAPNIGDSDAVEEIISLINKASKAPKKEKEAMTACLQALQNLQKDFEEIQGKIKEFVLG